MYWTDERISTLKKLWLDGLSAGQIARQLGGVTRNAVVGKVHRLGLSGRAAPSQLSRPATKALSVPHKPKRALRTPAPTPAAATAHHMQSIAEGTCLASPPVKREPVYFSEQTGSATILTLGFHMCKWPIGDPALDGFSFCGRKAGENGPYCVDHACLAYQSLQKKMKRPGDVDLARSLRRYI